MGAMPELCNVSSRPVFRSWLEHLKCQVFKFGLVITVADGFRFIFSAALLLRWQVTDDTLHCVHSVRVEPGAYT